MKVSFDKFKNQARSIYTPEKIALLRYPPVYVLITQIFLIYLQIFIGISIFIYSDNLILNIFSVVLVGTAQHGFSLFAHESVHGAFVKNRKINNMLGMWLFSYPILLPFNLYKVRHLQHHTFTSTDMDTKNLYRSNISGLYFIFECAKSLLLVDYAKQVFAVLKRAEGDRIVKLNQIYIDIIGLVITQLFIFYLFNAAGHWEFYLIIWLYPIFSVYMLTGKLRSIVEHKPIIEECEISESNKYYLKTTSEFTRSVNASWLERILFSKLNFHLHLVHHTLPAISFYYFPSVDRDLIKIAENLGCENSQRKSYFSVIRYFIFSK